MSHGVDPSFGVGMAMTQAEVALGVEDVAVEPDIGVSEPVASASRVGKHLERACSLTIRCCDHGETARRHTFPAGIAELAGSGKGLAQTVSYTHLTLPTIYSV